ncbi:MAG TPA: cellulase family glycosylhydrolase [Candidatus Saccharimonadales bacterium]|nr:cellulase family glycosylhydrolase [Candidatus Saccharimonadales bacterium]
MNRQYPYLKRSKRTTKHRLRVAPVYSLKPRPPKGSGGHGWAFSGILLVLVGIVLALTAVKWPWKGAGTHKSGPGTGSSAVVSPAGTPAVIPAKAYGIAAGSSLTALSGSDLDSRLRDMAALGVKWVRYDFDWSLIQPKNAQDYQWSSYDNLVAASNKYHLQVLGILDYTPGWARKGGCGSSQCPPANAGQFGTFAAAVANRYKGQGVHAWEIWNEPNNQQFWQPGSDPAAYAALLKNAFPAIKTVDKDAYVLTAGLSPQATTGSAYSPLDFLTAVYAQGGKAYFDGVADHPYTFPLSPNSSEDHAWNQMARTTNSLRQIMVVNGDSQKKIWITEFGAPTGGPGALSTVDNPNLDAHPYKVDDGLQAKILSDAVTLYRGYDWVGPFFVYTFKDPGTDQSTNENFFGLTRADGSHKPAYDVYKAAITAN